MPARQLPARPDLRQLKHQAKELLRDFRAGTPSAIAEFAEFAELHPDGIVAQSAKLADAQLVLARSYQAASWPRLVAVCALIEAIRHEDVAAINRFAVSHADVVREYSSVSATGWRSALTSAANDGLRRIITVLRQRGASDVDAAHARAELRPMLDAVRVLGQFGAQFPADAIGGAVESLAGANFAFMVEIGTAIEDERGDWRSRVALALETSARDADGKHRILETMAAHGIALPDTPPMAVHRGRIDLLEAWRRHDPMLLRRTFSHRDFFPPELGCHADESLALVGAPLDGATLLHQAIEYEEIEIARWLLDQGMEVDTPAAIDATGFGGHTALFQCVVTYNAGRRDDRGVRLLLDRGANPNARASLRKGLAFARDAAVHTYRDVTPLGWGRHFHDPSYVSQAALRVIAERGGVA